ncbi:MAG: pantoate--beta-alanine ligase [Terriglobia bacterium]
MNTRLITSIPELQSYVREVRLRGRSLALVPTMGALHEGHQSLIRRAKQQCDAVLVSIFVNPTQFNSGEDFASYPRDLQKDAELLCAHNVDRIFAPRQEDIYPAGFDTFVEPGKLAVPLEGVSRPGHFRGVGTIVLKMFNLAQPDVAYFGQKDLQQVQVIRRMVEDLNLNVRLVVCPIVREADGLALSSRNALLSAEERQAAAVLHRCLRRGQMLVHAGEVNARDLLQAMLQVVVEQPLVALDYLALVNPSLLEPVERVTAGTVGLIAARVGSVRLIDNLIFGPPGADPELLLQLAFSARPVIDTGARIPGLETEALCRRIANCRDCAALSAVMIPPREFLAMYLKRDYPDLNHVRVAVIGRDGPMDPDHYFYKHPDRPTRFASALFALLGLENFQNFKKDFVLMDALRCHVQSDRIPERALLHCARHLRDELKQFPNLQAVVILGEDAYQQFQRNVLERRTNEIRPFEELLKPQGWAEENTQVPFLKAGTLHAIYCYHPTTGYKRSRLPAEALPPLSP